MALFKHKLTGEIIERPAHYANHPVFGKKLIPVNSATPIEAQQSKTEPTVVVEPEVTPEPLTSAAEPEFTEEIEVNIETDKE
jgi:hypothetical protein